MATHFNTSWPSMATSQTTNLPPVLDEAGEIETARKMMDLEERARELLQNIPQAAECMTGRTNRSCRTRGVEVDQLIEAARVCARLKNQDGRSRALIGEARALMEQAEALRWQLALSARHLVKLESARLGCSLMGSEDLKQHGYVGLLEAAKRFDPDKGIRFVSYARWWVRAEMTRAIEHEGRTVRLPGGAVEQLRRLAKAQKALEREGVEPTLEMLSEETGLSKKRIRFLRSRGEVVSMEEQEDDGLPLYERIADDENDNADERLEMEQLRVRMRAVLSSLSERDLLILNRHFGLEGEEETSLTTLGRDLQISRERVRQLRGRALQNLRLAIDGN